MMPVISGTLDLSAFKRILFVDFHVDREGVLQPPPPPRAHTHAR